MTDQPPIRIVTDQPLVHRDDCLDPNPVLVYADGWVRCAYCGALVPGRVELAADSATAGGEPDAD
jgi:hypothetical protein